MIKYNQRRFLRKNKNIKKKIFCMIMRKNDRLQKKQQKTLAKQTKRLLAVGWICIALPLLGVTWELQRFPTLSLVALARFGGMMEHILAATAILIAGAYLVERSARVLHNKDN